MNRTSERRLALAFAILLAAPATADVFETYTDEAAFLARLGDARGVDFDDVAAPPDPAPFDRDRYRATQGVRIAGEDGQYAGTATGFVFPMNPLPISPVSEPNMYAPGPPALLGDPLGSGGNTTEVTFFAGESSGEPAAVAGFGVWFIDADNPALGASFFEVYGPDGSLLAATGDVSGGDASQLFRGIVAVDAASDLPKPAIGRVVIQNGSGWPAVLANESVGLDDFWFGAPQVVPEPAAAATAAAAAAGVGLISRLRRRERRGVRPGRSRADAARRG